MVAIFNMAAIELIILKTFFSIKSLFLILEVQNFTQLIVCGWSDRIDIKRINRYGDKTDIRTIYFIRDKK